MEDDLCWYLYLYSVKFHHFVFCLKLLRHNNEYKQLSHSLLCLDVC